MNIKSTTIQLIIGVYFASLILHATIVNGQDLSDLLVNNDKTTDTAAPPDKVIAVDHTKLNDKKIEKRLQEIFSELDDLKNLKVFVSNGIAILEGEVASKVIEDKAINFANQIEGVVEVENKLVVTQSLDKRLQKTLTHLNVIFLSRCQQFVKADGNRKSSKFTKRS